MGLRRFLGTAAQRASSALTGNAGDIFYETDTNAFGVADGSTPLKNLKRHMRIGELTVNVRDYGAIGDGTSRPLSTQGFATLTAAQAVYPHATALTNELDWAAIQLAVNTGAGGICYPAGHYITNRQIIPKDNQHHYGQKRASWIENIAPRNTPALYQTQANVFGLGDVHPIIQNPTQTGYVWSAYETAQMNDGDMQFTVLNPGAVSRAPAVGEKVLLSSIAPTADGNLGLIHDFEQWNKVKTYDPATGIGTVEDPIIATIVSGRAPTSGASGAPATPATPTISTPSTTLGRFYAAGTYSWRITAVNASGESAPSTSVSSTLGTNLENRLLSWSAVSGATSYRVYRVNPTGDEVLTASVTTTSYTDAGYSTILSAPRLWISAGSDLFSGLPWAFADSVSFKDLRLSGVSPFGTRTAAWRCSFENLNIEAQDLMSCNAFVHCYANNIHGTFSGRFIEIAHCSKDTTLDNVRGKFRFDSTNPTPSPPMNIGEQSYNVKINEFDIDIGNTYPTNARALQVGAAQRLKLKGGIRHYGTGGQTEAWSVNSSINNARPPSDLELDLHVRAGVGLSNYGAIGGEIFVNGLYDEAVPTRVTLRLNQRTPNGSVGAVGVLKTSQASDVFVESLQGDAVRAFQANPADWAQNVPFVLTTISALSVTAGAAFLVGGADISFVGAKGGDIFHAVSLQPQGTITTGSAGDLVATAVISSSGLARVYVRNLGTTNYVSTGNTNVYAMWRRGRA